MVPGGAFGLSKCWPAERFAKTADWLIDKFNAIVLISVSPAEAEKKIANQISKLSNHKLINMADYPLSIGELKSLYSICDLVICNDTGPRHIAIALKRKVITLFGPNDPEWTQTGYDNEVQIIGNASCAPCANPVCKMKNHFCMEDISIERVCQTAAEFLTGGQMKIWKEQKFTEIASSFYANADFEQTLEQNQLYSFDSVFSFKNGTNLAKNNLASFRSRTEFQLNSPPVTAFLKRYDNPPLLNQLKNWIAHRQKKSFAMAEFEPVKRLNAIGINTPNVIAYGEQWGLFFEKRSFIISEKIADAQSLERKIPMEINSVSGKRNFIKKLAKFIRRFHCSGFRHRDLYFSHIFYNPAGKFYLIDLARVFKPGILAERFRLKDISQLFYSAPGKYFSKTDRLRFYFDYAGIDKLTSKDKIFIRKMVDKVKKYGTA